MKSIFILGAAALAAVAAACTETNVPSACQGDEAGGPGCPCESNDDCASPDLECLSRLCVVREGDDKPRTKPDGGARRDAGSTTAGTSASAGKGGMSGGGAAADGGMSGDAGMSGEDPPCETEPVADEGVFISVAGADSNVCGTPGAPCRTFGHAFSRLAELSRSKLYVGPGVFEATFTLTESITISGGWDVTWKRDCARPSDTTLKANEDASPGAPVVAVSDGKVRFEHLTIEGKDAASVEAAESTFALLVTGASTEVELLGVELAVPSAGDGLDGMDGTTPAMATGTCGGGSGANGMAGTPGSAMAGSFTADGYSPGNGVSGGSGAKGETGMRTLAQPGSSPNYSCMLPCGANHPVTLPKGEDGEGGCGGDGGSGGTAGQGGGSSVALFVWDAKVTAWGGTFRAGDGGNGGDGALGAPGAAGASGRNGANGPTVTVEPTCCGAPTNVFAAGGTGMKGGDGGQGGDGGAGSGGHSYAIYAGGSATVEVNDTVLQIGAPGMGGGGPIPGLKGEAKPRNR